MQTGLHISLQCASFIHSLVSPGPFPLRIQRDRVHAFHCCSLFQHVPGNGHLFRLFPIWSFYKESRSKHRRDRSSRECILKKLPYLLHTLVREVMYVHRLHEEEEDTAMMGQKQLIQTQMVLLHWLPLKPTQATVHQRSSQRSSHQLYPTYTLKDGTGTLATPPEGG